MLGAVGLPGSAPGTAHLAPGTCYCLRKSGTDRWRWGHNCGSWSYDGEFGELVLRGFSCTGSVHPDVPQRLIRLQRQICPTCQSWSDAHGRLVTFRGVLMLESLLAVEDGSRMEMIAIPDDTLDSDGEGWLPMHQRVS